jgi:hypothetical protein
MTKPFESGELTMLVIKDLRASKALDRNAMASVSGGRAYKHYGFPFKTVTKTKENLYDVQKEYEFSSDIGF